MAADICTPAQQAFAAAQELLAVPVRLGDRDIWPSPHLTARAAAILRAMGVADPKARFEADIAAAPLTSSIAPPSPKLPRRVVPNRLQNARISGPHGSECQRSARLAPRQASSKRASAITPFGLLPHARPALACIGTFLCSLSH
jgi:hypothetical protein